MRNLVNVENQSVGFYEVKWDGKNAFGVQQSSGIYFYKMVAGNTVITKKMMLIQ